MPASEAIEAYEERLLADPDFRAKEVSAKARREDRVKAVRAAQAPILEDLRSAGYDLTSVQDLAKLTVPYPAAIPVLIDHLGRGGYPDRLLEMLGRRLAVTLSAAQWDAVAGLYERATGKGEKEGLAVALSAAALPERFEDLVALLVNPFHGVTRVYFVKAVKRVGGHRGAEILSGLADDPVLGREIRAVLKLPQGR